MNFKAWDNNEASYGFSVSAFVGFNSLWETMGLHDKQFGSFGSLCLWFASCTIISLWDSGMKEGCSGENVLERER